MEGFGVGPSHIENAGAAFQGLDQAANSCLREMAFGAGKDHIAPVKPQIDLPGEFDLPGHNQRADTQRDGHGELQCHQ